MNNKAIQPNKLLVGLFSLDHKIRVYVPSTMEVNKPIDNKPFVDEGLGLFSDLFGGSTAFEAMGAFRSTDKGLVTEKVTIVEAYCDRDSIEVGLQTVIEYAESLKKRMTQESIALEYDNVLYFI